jgi:hypothetical protein
VECCQREALGVLWREEHRGETRTFSLLSETSKQPDILRVGGDASRGFAKAVEEVFLPPGYPDSVSEDYLGYALLSFPTHVTGWLHSSLATAALLHAVGLGGALQAGLGAGAAPALTSAAKWVLKDGLGAAGRLAVAGRVAGLLDASPRQWRLYGEAASLAGGALEIATVFAPLSAFLPLAAAGTALRAAAKGVAAPSHAVILAHFAASSPLGGGQTANLGALAAKEEVQEVAAQLTGLALSVALLQQLGGASAAEENTQLLATAWACAAVAHFALRYAALRGVRFRTLNARRGLEAAHAHGVVGEPPQRWSTVEALNAREATFAPDWALPRRMHLGASVQAAVAGGAGNKDPASLRLVEAALRDSALACAQERFLITWRDGTAWVVLRQGATPRDALRATWLAAKLLAGPAQHSTAPGAIAQLHSALEELRERFGEFEALMEAQGWDLRPLMPPPSITPRLLAA